MWSIHLVPPAGPYQVNISHISRESRLLGGVLCKDLYSLYFEAKGFQVEKKKEETAFHTPLEIGAHLKTPTLHLSLISRYNSKLFVFRF